MLHNTQRKQVLSKRLGHLFQTHGKQRSQLEVGTYKKEKAINLLRILHSIASLANNQMNYRPTDLMISQNLAPIWLPHWPACTCTISLMVMGNVVDCLKEYFNLQSLMTW